MTDVMTELHKLQDTFEGHDIVLCREHLVQLNGGFSWWGNHCTRNVHDLNDYYS